MRKSFHLFTILASSGMAASGQDLDVLASCLEVTIFIRRSLQKSFISRLRSFRARFQCFGQLPGNHAFHKEILSYILMGNVLSAKKNPSFAASGLDFQVWACCSKVIFFIMRSLYISFVSGLGGFRSQISQFWPAV